MSANRDMPSVAAPISGGNTSMLIFTGVKAFVDCSLEDGSDVSDVWQRKLEERGAKVVQRWPGAAAKLTHLVWQNGKVPKRAQQALLYGIPVCGVDWVEDCIAIGRRLDEFEYQATW
ncbi:unnamed protein product, partial [Phaeothamnion confervicola]